MLFGAISYKLQLLNAQNRQRIVSSRLTRATKTIHQLSKSLTQQKRLYIQMYTPDKMQFVNDKIQEYFSRLGGSTSYEEFQKDATKMAEARMYGLSAYTELQTQVSNDAEDMYDEEANSQMEAAKQEEEDLQTESEYLKQLIEILQQQIKQAEQWFKDSIQMLFGGGR